MNETKKIAIAYYLIFSVFILTGCGQKLQVTQYPPSYRPGVKNIAILPFDNATSYENLGVIVAQNLASALSLNKTYNVTGPIELTALIKDNNLPALPLKDSAVVADELAQLNKFDAFISGTVSSAKISERPSITQNTPGNTSPSPSPQSAPPHYYAALGYYPSPSNIQAHAHLAAEVSFVSVPEGTILDSVSVDASSNVKGISKPARKNALLLAISDLSDKLVEKFAVVPTTVKVRPKQDLKTADSFRRGNWHYTTDFSQKDESMYVLVCLPPAAADNSFTLSVTPKNAPDKVVVEQDFDWPKNTNCQSLELSPEEIASKTGPGDYSLHFQSEGKPVMTKTFKIK